MERLCKQVEDERIEYDMSVDFKIDRGMYIFMFFYICFYER